MLTIRLLIVTAVALAGCEGAHLVGDAGPGPIDAAVDGLPGEPDAVDVLFVIDNSGTMLEEQDLLVAAFPAFIAALDQAAGGRPSLHLGVITTDIGAGNGIVTCEAGGDRGVLQNTPFDGACTPPEDRFIRDVPTPSGRDINYPDGTLAETFGCIAQVGTDGCGFEMPLEAMRQALDGRNLENEGFLREGALLAVIFVTDEDDCSVDNVEMFDDPQATVDDPLGPFGSYRCFDFGVDCDLDDRSFGPRSDCRAAADSAYLIELDPYLDLIAGLKPPGRFVTAAIAGPLSPVVVQEAPDSPGSGEPALAPSCTAGLNSAVPAIRLGELTASFGARGRVENICDVNADALATIAELIANNLP